MTLKNKVVIVTGSNGRIGTQVLKDLINKKAIVISCDVKKPKIKYLNNFFKIDVTNQESTKKFLNFVKKSLIELMLLSIVPILKLEIGENLLKN